ncbi:MAG: pantoate--beta-alanine ligase [Planctomycetales bacterium]|nr:pantoate--beta-alanine ligase [Planctomycetales bacterium]
MPSPTVVHDLDQAYLTIMQSRAQGTKWGLVPTMGALHDGHLSLVQAARETCDAVAVTIFVNPTQFGPGEDLDRYPRTWEADLAALEQHQVDLVFAPTIESMYPPGCTTRVRPSDVAADLEGRFRPDHFEGVATIVLKLFQVLPAEHAFFGQKDYQQCLVVRDMVRDLNLPIHLSFRPTVREADGLALSSRNRYLSDVDRQRALGLSRALAAAAARAHQGERDPQRLEALATQVLEDAGVDRIDYVALRDADTLVPLKELADRAVMLIAAHVGATRLIDNRVISVVASEAASQG